MALAGSVMAFSVAALADGMPRGSLKDAPYAAPFSWTGFYVGLNAGGAWTDSDINNTVCSGAGCYFAVITSSRLNSVGSGKIDDRAFTGGGQLGYNWQLSSLVLGAEADLNSMRTSASRQAAGNYVLNGVPNGSGLVFNDTVTTSYMATVRGRVGYASGSLLTYFTGGAAFTNFKHSHSAQEFGFGAGCSAATNWCDVPGSATTKMGWTIGGGAEWALDNHWSLKAEYLYADFGSVTSASNMNGFTHQPLSGPDRADRARGYQLQVLN